MTLAELSKQVLACSRCALRGGATAPVPGLGECGAKYFIIGEAPGREEDRDNVPFVGMAGKRLNKLLALGGINPNDCYITNTIKCRPPTNRTPRKGERLACYPWLKAELDLVQPQNIIALGATSTNMFTEDGIKRRHGTMEVMDVGGRQLPIMFQYHPAAALHQPRLWAVMLDDWEHPPEQVDSSFVVVSPQRKFPDLVALDTENDEKGDLSQWSLAFRDEAGQLCVAPFQGKNPHLRIAAQTVMHHAKWDIRVLKANGMTPPENIVDTFIGAYCMGLGRQDTKDSGRSGDQMVGGLGLKYLARRHLGMEMQSWDEVKDGKGDMAEYNAKDSVATYLLWEKWQPHLPQHFWDIDMPLLPVLMAMEDRGILVDPNFLQEYAKVLDEKLGNIELPLNPFSPKQVAEYVFGTLGYEPTKFTDTKQPSVDKEVLEQIDDPIVRRILEYREFYKERKTYVSSYINRMQFDNRIHCDFKQTGTATGRLSSARPNLQNVTRDTELRRLFVAPEGLLLIRTDWSQLELRVFAAIANERTMLGAIEAGRSIHQETADRIGLSYDESKTINFLMLYGGGAWKISQEFHVPIDKAKALIADYYKAYPGIKRYHEQQTEIAHEQRKVVNWFGRTRRLDGMYSEHWRTIKDTEREAINTPVQGAAAEVVKLAMIDLHEKHRAPMILQVHDELLFEVPEKEAKEYAQWLKEYVPTITEINGVRFPIEVSYGRNWKEAKEGA